MERRAKKRKGPVLSEGPKKRAATQLSLLIRIRVSYMKDSLGLYQYFNTCVPDTLLASFHILYMKHLNIRALLELNRFFKELMFRLNKEKYAYARAIWIRQLNDFNKLDRLSTIKKHFPVIDKLVCAKVDYHQETHSGHPIYEKTLSKFHHFGDLWVLGDISDPSIILVHREDHNHHYNPCMNCQLPLNVEDDKRPRADYLKAGGTFSNTCVLDSFLAAFHLTSKHNKYVMVLLNENTFWKKAISLLEEGKYTDARNHCVVQLNLHKSNLLGFVKDYLPLIHTLECGTITYKQNSPNNSAIYTAIPSILLKCGDVMVLGHYTEPTLILVHREIHNGLYQDCLSTELPLCVSNENKRTFIAQFFLLGKGQHMTMCFQSGNSWYQYDNDPGKPSIQEYNITSLEEVNIYLAGYVNKTQAQEEKLSIAETGETAGTKPFVSDMNSSIVEEMETDDPLPYPIPETGKHLGPTPFFDNQPQIHSMLNNMGQQGEDVEMVSCSDSDSESQAQFCPKFQRKVGRKVTKEEEEDDAMQFHFGLVKQKEDPSKHFYSEQPEIDVEMEDLTL